MAIPYLQLHKRSQQRLKDRHQVTCLGAQSQASGVDLHCMESIARGWPCLPAPGGQGFGGSPRPLEQLPVFDKAVKTALSPPTLFVSYSGRGVPGIWGRNKDEGMSLKVSSPSSLPALGQDPGKGQPPPQAWDPGCLRPQLSHMWQIKLRDKGSPSRSFVTGQLPAWGASGTAGQVAGCPKLGAVYSRGHAGHICREGGEARKPLASSSRLSQDLRGTCSQLGALPRSVLTPL